MLKVEINKKQEYKVRQDYSLLEIEQDYRPFRNENNYRYIFEILHGTFVTSIYKNKTFQTLRFYAKDSMHSNNILVSNNWIYEFSVMNLFNSNSNLYNYSSLTVYKFFNNVLDSSQDYHFNEVSVLEILKEFDALDDSADVQSLKLKNEHLEKENKELKAVIKDFRKRANASIKKFK